VFGVENLERGFENSVPSFNALGADMRVVEDADEDVGYSSRQDSRFIRNLA
jgi:hypothetical protein